VFANGQLFLGDAYVGPEQKYQNNHQLCFRPTGIYTAVHLHLSADTGTTQLEGFPSTTAKRLQQFLCLDAIARILIDVPELGI
jgi:hypothetical protein